MILCCGEALIDMLPCKLASGNEAYMPLPGGAVFNTSVVLGRLSQQSGLFCGISTDQFGVQLVRTLDDAGVDRTLCPRVANPTTLAFVSIAHGQARYSFFDENSALR